MMRTIESHIFGSSWRDIYSNLMHILSCSAGAKNPTHGGKCWLSSGHNHIDPKLVGTRSLIIEILKRSLLSYHSIIRKSTNWSPTLRTSPLTLKKNFFLILYWSAVDLQCCVSFMCTAKWFVYVYTHISIFFFQILFPFRLSQDIE